MKHLILAICMMAGLILATACTETVVITEDHYGECSTDEQCPGTSVCLDGICVELAEPQPICEQYEWAGGQTPWHCWCEGNDCTVTDPELPWSCPLDLIPTDESCRVLCRNHFLLGDAGRLDPNTSPPSLTFDASNDTVITCTQYVDMSPLRFVRSQTTIYSDPAINGVAGVNFRMTKPGMAVVSVRYNQDTEWLYGGNYYTYSIPMMNLNNIGSIRYGGLPSGTTVYWQLEARVHMNQAEVGDIWVGSQIVL